MHKKQIFTQCMYVLARFVCSVTVPSELEFHLICFGCCYCHCCCCRCLLLIQSNIQKQMIFEQIFFCCCCCCCCCCCSYCCSRRFRLDVSIESSLCMLFFPFSVFFIYSYIVSSSSSFPFFCMCFFFFQKSTNKIESLPKYIHTHSHRMYLLYSHECAHTNAPHKLAACHHYHYHHHHRRHRCCRHFKCAKRHFMCFSLFFLLSIYVCFSF